MTLIGNKRELAFELVPVTPSWEIHYSPERAAWAGTAIWVGGENLCRHVMPGSSEVQEYFFIPLGPLADWFVRTFAALEFEERAPLYATTRRLHSSVAQWGYAPPPQELDEDDWIDAREAWWSRHFLRAGADGARVPEMAFVRDDEELAIDWRAPQFFGPDAPSMLAPEGHSSIPWLAGRLVLEELTAKVAEWLREGDAEVTYSWAQEQNPLIAHEPRLREALGLFTGRSLDVLMHLFQADEFSQLLASLHLSDTGNDPAASPQCQILRDLSPGLDHEVGELISEIGDRVARENRDALRKWSSARIIALDAARAATSPEEAGQLAASGIRESLGLDSEPIDDLEGIVDCVGLSYTDSGVTGHYDRMLLALRQSGSLVATILRTRRTATRWGRRFELSRAIGHVLLDPVRLGAIGAASGPFAQETRRRRSGSFAAELLLPQSAISPVSGGRLDVAAQDQVFTRLLEEYGIGARAAAYQLWNRGWLSSPEVRDELIERFSSVDAEETGQGL